MKNKNKLIAGLIIIGIVFFCIVMSVVIKNNENGEQYKTEQLEATTADINYIIEYKNKYMGNNSNTINLFYHLPLSTSNMTFELFPDDLTVQINFQDTLLIVGKESMSHKQYAANGLADELSRIYRNNVEKSMIYNSTAAFALIDNLEHITYHFSDISYTVDRADVESLYSDFGTILNVTNWKNEVQDKLKDSAYVSDSAKKVLIEKE